MRGWACRWNPRMPRIRRFPSGSRAVDRLVKTVDQERNTTTVEAVTSRKETRLGPPRAVQGRLSKTCGRPFASRARCPQMR